jgi:predicted permease
MVGRSINVSGTSFEVVGLAREELKFPPGLAAAPPDLWLPLAFGQNARAVRGNRSFQVIARLRGGVPLARANEDLTGVATAFVAENANNYPAGAAFAPSVHSIVNDMRANVKPTLLLFMGAVLFVLLVGCANLANLLLVRGSARQSELAVRIALGASARTVVAQLLSESFLISVGGALFGVALSLVTLKVLIAIGGTTVPWLAEATIDWRVLSFAAATTVVTTIAFGLFPARSAVSLSFHQSIRAGGKGSTGNAAQRRTRSLLLAGEIAVATVLLSGSALLLKSFQRVLSDSPGFRPEGVITARVTAPGARFADTTAVRGFYTELVRVVGEIPGVEQASLASILPLSGNRTDWSFAIEGRVIGAGSPPPDEQIRQIAPGYFATIGSSMVEGRDFLPTDRVGAGLVVIVNHALAAKWWPGESAIGKRVSFSGQNATPEWRTVVGIVADMRHNALDAPMEPQLYLPFAQTPFLTRGMSVVARVHDPSPAVSAALQRAIATVDPGQPTRQVSTIMSLVTASVAPRRFAMLLISGFATLSLVIAALGTFAVTAFAVTQRTREMGIRMALGASPGDAVRSIVREGAVIAVLGIVAGVAAAIPAMGVIRNQLYGVSAVDPSSLVTVAAALATIAVGASYLPARRIARVSPTIALRDE